MGDFSSLYESKVKIAHKTSKNVTGLPIPVYAMDKHSLAIVLTGNRNTSKADISFVHSVIYLTD